MRARTACVVLALSGMPAALSAEGAGKWSVYRDGSGTSVQYPQSLFSKRQQPEDGRGAAFISEDGRARLQIFTVHNGRNETPAQYLRRVFPGDRRHLDYDRVARTFFAVSEENDALILYRRCNFVRDQIHCVDIRYPRREKRAWDAPVTRISLSLRPR